MLDVLKYSVQLNKMVKQKKVSKDTAVTYLSCIRVLNDYLNENKDILIVLKNKVKKPTQIRKYLNAINKYQELVPGKELISKEAALQIINEVKNTAKVSKPKDIDKQKVNRKINGIHDEKLRLAFRLQEKSGLRVSEIASLTSENIKFENGSIIVDVINGKGGKSRTVNVVNDPYLYNKLQDFINKSDENKRLFYDRKNLKDAAAKIGIETHDLRRLNARMRLDDEMNGGKNFKQAREIVQGELGHSFPATTDIYLGRKGRKNEQLG